MTINEIAKEAGVSIGTVDRVLHNRGRVSQETVEKVNTIVARYGYQPNPIARQLKRGKPYVIGALLPTLNSEYGYWNMQYQGMCEAAKELAAFNVELEFAEFDRMKTGDCLEKGRSLLAKNVDSLIIAPVSQTDMLQLAVELGDKPYVFVDSSLPDASPVAIVVQNAFKAGYCAGRMMYMASGSPAKGCYASIQLHTAYNLKERSRGFSAYFEAEHRNSFTVRDFYCKDGNLEVFLERVLSECPDLSGIFVTNDAVHQVAEFFSSRPQQQKVTLIGYDLVPQNVECIKQGSVACVISQGPQNQGSLAVNTLYRRQLMGRETEEVIQIPIDIYFKENVL